jgi:hypothetical protein
MFTSSSPTSNAWRAAAVGAALFGATVASNAQQLSDIQPTPKLTAPATPPAQPLAVRPTLEQCVLILSASVEVLSGSSNRDITLRTNPELAWDLANWMSPRNPQLVHRVLLQGKFFDEYVAAAPLAERQALLRALTCDGDPRIRTRGRGIDAFNVIQDILEEGPPETRISLRALGVRSVDPAAVVRPPVPPPGPTSSAPVRGNQAALNY